MLLAPLTALCALAAAPGAERPRLAVVLVVDQLSAEVFDQRLPSAKQGFKRLVDEGYRFIDARYEAVPPLTSPGHATLSTGAYPETHGIVSNDWFDPLSHRSTYSVEDPRYAVLGDPPHEPGVGPGHLKAGTLADAVKLSFPESRVVSLAGKDRAAVLLAGQTADVALWVSHHRPEFTTSTLYGHALPEWVAPINERLQQAAAQGLVWKAPTPAAEKASVERSFHRDRSGFGQSFPHQLPPHADGDAQSEALLHHPLVDAALVDLAIAALQAEQLGKRASPDLLLLSFSPYDFVTHAFGPDSPEAEAMFADLDGQVGRLLGALDKEVGRGRYTVVLTADHGGGPVPEIARLRGLDAGRLDLQRLTNAVQRAADEALGTQEWWLGFHGVGLYAAPGSGAALATVFPRLRTAALAVSGVLDVWPRAEVAAGGGGETGRLLRHGLDPERSPDYLVLTRPYWMYGTEDAAGHGTIHLYDRRIPMVWMGTGIRHGEGVHAETVDVAPTVALLLGSDPPADATGRPLTEALNRFMR